MRITIARLTGLAALLALLLGGAGLGQQGSDAKDARKPAEEKKPSQLEELIAQALRDNPDLRVADAKLREADAELNRVRLQVIQKVVAHQHTIETLDSAVKTAEASYRMAEAKLKQADADYKRLMSIDAGIAQADLDAGRANLETAKANLDTAKAALQAAKADLAKAQAELPYLLGKSAKGGKLSSTEIGLQSLAQQQVIVQELDTLVLREAALNALGTASAKPQGSVADRLRKALDTPTTLRAAAGMPLDEVLDVLQKAADVPIVNTLRQNQVTLQTDFDLQKVPLGAAFQCVEDVAGVQFGVRDYGIVVSRTLPSGVTRLHDFWKSEPQQKKVGDKPQ
jgi:hypothetical protein